MNKPWASRPLALGGAVLGILAVATPAVQADPVKVKLVKSATVSVAGSPDSTFPFNNDQPSVSQFDCGKGYVPIAAGWKGTNTPTSGPGWFVGTKKDTTKYGYRLSIARGLAPGSMQARTVCAKGPVKAVRKETAQGSVARCGSKTALGYMNLVSVKQSAAVSSTPAGRTGWRQEGMASEYSNSAAVCVHKKAFKKVRSVTKSTSFTLGNRTATIVAKCPKGSRALAWGFSSPLMPANAWSGSGSIQSPFVESAVPAKSKWTLTFSTPDLQGAKEQSQVSATAVCGQPRSR
jgi:hypothetical protein